MAPPRLDTVARRRGTWPERADILRYRPQTIEDILRRYGVYEGEVLVDNMPTPYLDLRQFPADLVIGVEIYRRNRPTRWAGTMSDSALSFRPLVQTLPAPNRAA